MRIISGTHKGRRIHPPAQMPHTRPTTDVAKEGLFNILQHSIDFNGLKTLDLFGGTGSISFELASRGASELTIVEKDPKMAAFIKTNSETFNFQNIKLIRLDVFKFLESNREQYDFIFAGPPYALTGIDEIPRLIHRGQLLTGNGIFVLEHTPRNDYKQFPMYSFERNYGTTIFSIFKNAIATND